MTRQCDLCRKNIECDRCDQHGASPNDHWHTCDSDCASGIYNQARPLETPREWRLRNNRPSVAKVSAEEYEYFLCDICLKHLNEHNEIGLDDMCPTCRADLLLREDEAAMRFLRAMRIRL
jgi:hypothetical protein